MRGRLRHVERDDAGRREGRLVPAPESGGDAAAIGLVADDDDTLASAGDGVEDVHRGRAWRQAVIRLGLDANGTGDLLRCLTRAQERAREHRVRRLSCREAAAEITGCRATGGGQPAKLVRVAGGGLRMANEIQAHLPRIGTAKRPSIG